MGKIKHLKKYQKNIFDMKHVKSVSVSILRDKTGDLAGKIISNWSDNNAGSVCTSQIFLYTRYYDSKKLKLKKHTVENFEGEFDNNLIASAGGYGYDKLSQSIELAIINNCEVHPPCRFGGAGLSAVQDWFKKELGLVLIEVL